MPIRSLYLTAYPKGCFILYRMTEKLINGKSGIATGSTGNRVTHNEKYYIQIWDTFSITHVHINVFALTRAYSK